MIHLLIGAPSRCDNQGLLNDAPIGIFISTPEGRFVTANQTLADMFGYNTPDALVETVTDIASQIFTDPADYELFKRLIYQQGSIKNHEVVMKRLDGSLIYTAVHAHGVRNGTGDIVRYHGFLSDISGRIEIVKALRETSAELEHFFTLSRDLLCIANSLARFIRVNPEWERVLGYTATEMEGRSFLDFVHPEDWEATKASVMELLKRSQTLNFETRCLCKDGTLRWIEWRSVSHNQRIYAAARDITDRKESEERLLYLATTDELTGLWNRRFFMQCLAREVERFERYGRPFSLLVLDIDHFKAVNDAHGHAGGDLVLRRLAEQLKHLLRQVDMPGRIGGEEFAVILPQTDLDGAIQMAERIRESIANLPIPVEQAEVRVTASIGAASYQPEFPGTDRILKLADEALYRAKNSGRNRTVAA